MNHCSTNTFPAGGASPSGLHQLHNLARWARRLCLVFLVGLVAIPAQTIFADNVVGGESTQYVRIQVVEVVRGLEHPWSLAFLPDGSYLVTERPGRLNRVRNGEITRITGLPEDIHARGQGGLMEVLPHPDFAENGWVYLTYSRGDSQGTATTLIRGRLEGDRLVEVERLFTQDRMSSPGRHYGSKLAWTPEGYLLMSIGDRGGEPPRAQDLADAAGTLLRLTEDGKPAPGNPFLDKEGALPEIYSYGHRNIQGLIVNAENGEIWSTEHGPRGGDELNRHEAGGNYGWPVVSRGLDYRTQETFRHTEARHSVPGMIDPVYELLPTLAPSGLALVTTDRYNRWQGDLIAGGLRAERLRRLVVQDDEVLHDEELILGMIGRIRDVRESPDGYLYVLNDRRDGGIYRIEPQ